MAIIHGEGRSFISKNKIKESKNNLTRPFDIKQKNWWYKTIYNISLKSDFPSYEP